MLEHLFSRRRVLAIVLVGVAIGPLMPASSSAQTREIQRPTCAELLVPEELADIDPEDLLFIVANCPGFIARAKAEEKREVVREPGFVRTESKEDTTVHLAEEAPVAVAAAAPVEADPIDLAESAGFAIKQKNETVIIDQHQRRRLRLPLEGHARRDRRAGKPFRGTRVRRALRLPLIDLF